MHFRMGINREPSHGDRVGDQSYWPTRVATRMKVLMMGSAIVSSGGCDLAWPSK
jgi:hypothetical protein